MNSPVVASSWHDYEPMDLGFHLLVQLDLCSLFELHEMVDTQLGWSYQVECAVCFSLCEADTTIAALDSLRLLFTNVIFVKAS